MSSAQMYDTLGVTYTATRRTDQRIADQIWTALGAARTVVNVGAGTGSYEPPGRQVLAVEPSAVMRTQRSLGAATCLAATAEKLPFADAAFEAAMAVSTIHHWPDPIAGLREMKRVAGRVVVLTYDLVGLREFWLARDYLPELTDLLAGHPSLSELARAIGVSIEPVLIPWDCGDGSRKIEASGDDPRHTWTRVCVAECRSGPRSGRTLSNEPCEVSGKISAQASGLTAITISSSSRKEISAFDCSSPESAQREPTSLHSRRSCRSGWARAPNGLRQNGSSARRSRGMPVDSRRPGGLPGVDFLPMAATTTVKVQTSTRDLILQLGTVRRQSADQVILAALAAMSRDERRQVAAAEALAVKNDPADLAEVRAIQREMAALHAR